MKLILWAAADKVALKSDAEVITVEEADMDAQEDLMVDVDEETDMAEEAGKTRDINGLDTMPEWYSVTMAHIQRLILHMTSQPTSGLG